MLTPSRFRQYLLRKKPDLRDRRSFLKASALMGGAMMLNPLRLLGNEASKNLSGQHFLVAGAGLSGLAAAWGLIKQGGEVTILEARNRIGGRVQTIRNFAPQVTVEAGGEFVGANHPNWLKLAEAFDLELREYEGDDSLSYPLFFDNKLLDAVEEESIWGEIEVISGALTEMAAGIDATSPWNSPNAVDLDNTSVEDFLQGMEVSDLGKRAFRVYLENYNAVPLNQQNLLAQLANIKAGGMDDYWTESESFLCNGGSDALVFALLREVGPQHLRMNAKVSRVDNKDDGVSVTLADGQKIEADHLIWTVPPSSWKGIRFEPELPAELSAQVGPTMKLLSRMRSRVWAEESKNGFGINEKFISSTWDSTSGLTDISNPVLTFFSTGEGAREIAALPADQRKGLIRKRVAELFPGYPKAVMDTLYVNWIDDELNTRGYSFPAPHGGVIDTQRLLSEAHGRIHFAGEHTSTGFVGFMEGALETGFRAADHFS